MNERDWIPAHRRLFKGAKKGLPRAIRFVLLELCHEARPTYGVLDFPPEWDTLTAVHDRIGGNRREIRKALVVFQEADETGTPVIKVERDRTHHRLEIVKWDSWSGPKSGTERSQLSRERSSDRVRTENDPNPVRTRTELEQKEPRQPEFEPKTTGLRSVLGPPPDNAAQQTEQQRTLANAKALHGSSDATPTGEERRRQERRGEGDATSDRFLAASSPELGALLARMRRHPILVGLPHDRIAEQQLGFMVSKGVKLGWVLDAIDECAAKCPDGLTAEARQAKLVGFMRHAKPPKVTPIDPETATRTRDDGIERALPSDEEAAKTLTRMKKANADLDARLAGAKP